MNYFQGKSQIKAEMSLKEQAAAVLLEYGKEIESVDEEKIRKIRSKIERNIDLGEAEISELRKVAISQDSKIRVPPYDMAHMIWTIIWPPYEPSGLIYKSDA